MLAAALDESNEFSRDKPLWLTACFITAAAFGVSVLAQLLVMLVEQRHGHASNALPIDTPLSLVRGALVVQFALATLIFFILRRYPQLRRRALARGKLSLRALVTSLGLVLGLAPVANDLGFRLSGALHQSSDNARWVTQIVRHASSAEFILLGVALTLLPAVIEESLFRGVLMGALSGARTWVTLVLQALAFGAFHVDLAQGIATLVLGLGFGFMRLKTRSLLAPIVSHATYNFVVLSSMRFAAQTGNPSPNQGLGIVLGGVLLSLACAFGLTRYVGRGHESTVEVQ